MSSLGVVALVHVHVLKNRDKTILNRSIASKFGLRLARVVLTLDCLF